MIVSSSDKKRARRIAAVKWNMVNRDYLHMPLGERAKLAKRLAEDDILAGRSSVGGGKGFGSVLTTLIIHLMIKIAIRLIEKWLEEKLFSVPEE